MVKTKRLFFSFSLLCLFVLSFCLVGSVTATGSLTEASAMYGYGSAGVGDTVYNYFGNDTGVFFLDTSYVGNIDPINSAGSYTLYANITDGGVGFSGYCDIYYSQQVSADLFNYMFSTYTYENTLDMTTNDYYYSGYDPDNSFNFFTNLPLLNDLQQSSYFSIKLYFYDGAGVSFNIYYVFVIDAFIDSPVSPTPAVLPTEHAGWDGVDWIDGGFDIALAPVIVQLLLVFILLIGLPMVLVVMVPKAGMIGFSGVMLVASVVCYAFLGFPVLISSSSWWMIFLFQ